MKTGGIVAEESISNHLAQEDLLRQEHDSIDDAHHRCTPVSAGSFDARTDFGSPHTPCRTEIP